jgi:hypothetical protein
LKRLYLFKARSAIAKLFDARSRDDFQLCFEGGRRLVHQEIFEKSNKSVLNGNDVIKMSGLVLSPYRKPKTEFWRRLK